MKNILLGFVLVFSFNAYSFGEKAVYGDDNRLNLYEVNDQTLVDMAASSAIMILNSKLENKGPFYSIISETLKERIPLCVDERFIDEPSPGDCTGFLVASDILVTAGHCIQNMSDCENSKWVFDYAYHSEGQDLGRVPKENVFSCAKILDREINGYTRIDYAIIRLDRSVVGRQPLDIREDGKIKKNTPLVLIGNPSGLPTKIAVDSHVYSNYESKFFKANTDSFQGNSGSPVINYETGLVEGILVRGEIDYVKDKERNCLVVNYCKSVENCRGEDVIRITKIKKLYSLIK